MKPIKNLKPLTPSTKRERRVTVVPRTVFSWAWRHWEAPGRCATVPNSPYGRAIFKLGMGLHIKWLFPWTPAASPCFGPTKNEDSFFLLVHMSGWVYVSWRGRFRIFLDDYLGLDLSSSTETANAFSIVHFLTTYLIICPSQLVYIGCWFPSVLKCL